MRTILILAAALPLAACGAMASNHEERGASVAASGSGGTRSFAVDGFSAVDLRGSDDIDVRVGPAFSVRAEGPAAELDKLDIRKDGSTLRVGRKDKDGFNWNGKHSDTIKVFVTLPQLVSASVSGSGDMAVDRVAGNFGAAVAGSGNLKLAAVQAEALKLSIAGSGGIAARGTASRASISVAGSGDLDGSGLKLAGADVSVAGSGNVRADVAGPAKVSVVGSGDVDLGASARCTTSKMGSGEVRCGS